MPCKRDFDMPAHYRIRVYGHLDSSRSYWFDDLKIREEAGDITQLQGEITDQAALFSILTRVRDLDLPLLSVERL